MRVLPRRRATKLNDRRRRIEPPAPGSTGARGERDAAVEASLHPAPPDRDFLVGVARGGAGLTGEALARGLLVTLPDLELRELVAGDRIHLRCLRRGWPRRSGGVPPFDEGTVVLGRGSQHRAEWPCSRGARLIPCADRVTPPYRGLADRGARCRAGRSSGPRERLRQIRDQIVDRLDPDRQPDEGLVDLELRAG